MLVIGESINATIKSVSDAIEKRDAEFIANLAQQQVDAGANMLDLNAGTGKGDESTDLAWLIDTVQNATDIPLVLDSSNPMVLVTNCQRCRKRPILSSLTLEEHSLEVLLPFIGKNDCMVLAMSFGGNKASPSTENIVEAGKQLIDKTGDAGLKPSDLYIDPAVMAIASDVTAGQRVLECIKLIKDYQPEVHIMCAVSNVSFGLPGRKLLNRTFMPMLATAGADAFMIDVRGGEMIDAITAADALLGNDKYCMNYIQRWRRDNYKRQV